MKNIKIPYYKKSDLEDIDTVSKKIAVELFDLPSGSYEIVIKKPTMTGQQHKASWLFMTWLSIALNESHHLWGKRFLDWFFKDDFEMEWDKDMIKQSIWNPLMYAFGVKSMTKLTTTQASKIAEYIQKNFDKKEIILNFPNWEDLEKGVVPFKIEE